MTSKTSKTKLFHQYSRAVLGLVLGAALSISAFAQNSREYIEGKAAGVNARIEVLGSAFEQPFAIGPSQSRIVVYRPQNMTMPGATSVFVNNEYHTSLINGAYSSLCYTPGAVEMGARQARVGGTPKDRMDTLSQLTLQPGQTQYLQVRDVNRRPVLQPVEAAVALQELRGLRDQIHTVSRVSLAQNCVQSTKPVVAAAPAPKRINLAADALFAFGRSDEGSISVAGRRSLDEMIGRIKSEYATIEGIKITGHADPLGSAAGNERLAESRAATIRSYLLMNGMQGARIVSEGRGSREPVVTNCPRVANAASIACNQPNRRVVVEIAGVN